jgi:Ca2+-binding EF-hand superfamily protein
MQDMQTKLTNRTAILAALVLTLAQPALAEDSPGKALAEATFKQIDANADGAIPIDELQAFRELVMVSMDADADGSVNLPEFQGWDFGFVNIAEESDKLEGFGTAQKMIFDFWDRDNDQKITDDEMGAAMVREMAYADLSADGTLDVTEFITGFSVMIAYRAALKVE